MEQTFYSNGKLLLTAEYLVLDGANALAIPTKYGQTLNIKPSEKKGLHWKSFDENNSVWFEGTFLVNDNKVQFVNEENNISKTLAIILGQAMKLNPLFLTESSAVEITTHLDFNRKWGLGTSSTLINNIAQWAKVDAFDLLKNSFGGSGYDIACAQNNKPILYSNNPEKPTIEEAELKWNFKDQIFFVYLNKKQDSKEGIAKYKAITKHKEVIIASINTITQRFLESETLSHFEKCIEEHEGIIASLLNMPKVKDTFFPDYPGSIKSLGAWGGDFVLVTGEDAKSYFSSKGFNTIIPFSEMIK